MSVSLVTPTQHSRLECLYVLRDMINEQTYFNKIKEWIIVDGSKTPEKITTNEINKLQEGIKVPIIFGEFKEDCTTIGKLRNRTNELTTGDIIVCMDDDDYYPPERVQEAYDNLTISNRLFAGCSSTYFYDFSLDKEYKFTTKFTHGDNHTHNNAMAYKREYLSNHKYDDTKTFAEESSFTNSFQEPMEQLTPEKTVVISSHMTNTFNKRFNISQYYNQQNPTVMETDFKILPQKYKDKMKKIFIKTTKSNYDIVYFCGLCPAYKDWDPKDESLGGSEQAVKYLSANFAEMGFKVAVFGNVVEGKYGKVDYIDWLKFPYHEEFNNIIVWRLLGLAYISFHAVKARKILFDLHDNMKYINMSLFYTRFIKNNTKFDHIMFKSNYHKLEFESGYKLAGEPVIIPNGLRIMEISNIINKSKIVREPYRFCYCSCYKRGLEHILRWTWPEIVKNEPRAELHLYYGMDNFEDPKYKSMMSELIGSSINVMNHGRQPLNIVIEERLKSTFQLYISNSVAEIDCISIREAILCGCIPLLSNNNVFKEREGIHFEIENPTDNKEETIKKYAESMMKIGTFVSNNFMKNFQEVEKYRNNLLNSKLTLDWKVIANAWFRYLYVNTNNNNIYPPQQLQNRIEQIKVEEKVPEKIEEKVPEKIEEKIPEKIPEKIEEKIEEKVPEKIEEKVPEKIEKVEDKKHHKRHHHHHNKK